jgi:hypothetical protein
MPISKGKIVTIGLKPADITVFAMESAWFQARQTDKADNETSVTTQRTSGNLLI